MARFQIHFTCLHSFIPEFISRLPTITTLSPLSTQDLRRILTDVRGSLISQYTALFGYSGVEIRFTTVAINQICLRAAERGGGARGLRGIMVTLLSGIFVNVLTKYRRNHCCWMQCMKFREFLILLFLRGFYSLFSGLQGIGVIFLFLDYYARVNDV